MSISSAIKGYTFMDQEIIRTTNSQISYPDQTNTIPRHGDDIASQRYAPPYLIFIPYSSHLPVIVNDDTWTVAFNNGIRYTPGIQGNPLVYDQKFKFLANPSSHNLMEYLCQQFIYQYKVTTTTAQEHKIISELNFGSDTYEYETHVVIQTDANIIPNMLCYTEIFQSRPVVKLLETYRISENQYCICGNFGAAAGYYFTLNSTSFDVEISSTEFILPSSGFIFDTDIEINKAASRIVAANKNSGMDVQQKYRLITDESMTGKVILRVPYYSFINYHPYGAIFTEDRFESDDLRSNVKIVSGTAKLSMIKDHDYLPYYNVYKNYLKVNQLFYVDYEVAKLNVQNRVVVLPINTDVIHEDTLYRYTKTETHAVITINNTTTSYEFKEGSQLTRPLTLAIFFSDMISGYVSRQVTDEDFEYMSRNFDGVIANFIPNRVVKTSENKIIASLRTESERDMLSACFLYQNGVFIRVSQLKDPYIFGNFVIQARRMIEYPTGINIINFMDIVNGSYEVFDPITKEMKNITISNNQISVSSFPFILHNIEFIGVLLENKISEFTKEIVVASALTSKILQIESATILEKVNIKLTFIIKNQLVCISAASIIDPTKPSSIKLLHNGKVYKYEVM